MHGTALNMPREARSRSIPLLWVAAQGPSRTKTTCCQIRKVRRHFMRRVHFVHIYGIPHAHIWVASQICRFLIKLYYTQSRRP